VGRSMGSWADRAGKAFSSLAFRPVRLQVTRPQAHTHPPCRLQPLWWLRTALSLGPAILRPRITFPSILRMHFQDMFPARQFPVGTSPLFFPVSDLSPSEGACFLRRRGHLRRRSRGGTCRPVAALRGPDRLSSVKRCGAVSVLHAGGQPVWERERRVVPSCPRASASPRVRDVCPRRARTGCVRRLPSSPDLGNAVAHPVHAAQHDQHPDDPHCTAAGDIVRRARANANGGVHYSCPARLMSFRNLAALKVERRPFGWFIRRLLLRGCWSNQWQFE
jgi:hypothetical protein